MHITKIEEFSFDHGQHFNTATGEYHSLNPHTLGRPLTHTEMDYNLIYQKQTLNGFRICGSNNDLTLALSDLGGRLEFTQISNSDADWPRFQAAGLFNGQFVWNPVGGALPVTTTTTAAPTTTTTTTSTTTTTTAAPPANVSYHANTNTSWVVPYANFTIDVNAIPTGGPYTIAGPAFGHSEGHIFAGWDTYSTTPMAPPQYQPGDQINLTPGSTTNFYARYDIPVYQNLTATPSPADEGQNIIINLSGINIPDGRTVGWTITGVDTNDISGSLTGTFTMNSNQAEYIITVTEDLVTEGTETLTLTCASDDNAGTDCGLSVAIDINDTSLTPTTTTTIAPTYTVTINAVTNPSNIVGSHPLVQSGLSAGNYTIPGPTWSVTGYTFIGYDTYSGTPMAPPSLQPGDVINITADVNLFARYTLTTTTTTTTTEAPVSFNCVTPGLVLSMDNGVVGQPIVASVTYNGTPLTINSITTSQGLTNVYLAGENSYTLGFTVPAGFSNSGQGVGCAVLATGTTTTTTSTTTTTTSTTTTAAPLLGYYFHGGNQSYPFAQGDGLTASPTGTLYYDDGAGNAFADTTDLSVAMTYIMDNMGTTYSPGNYTISSFNIPSSITALGNGDALNFDASTNAEFYYIILPDGQPDLTSVSPQHLVDGGLATNAIQKAQFTWNGVDYWIYKLGGGSQTAARTITFSDND